MTIQSDTNSLDPREIFAIFSRQARIFVSVVLVVLAVAALYLFTAEQVYTARSLIFVENESESLLGQSSGATINASAINSRVESEVAIVNSESVALATINELELLSLPDYRLNVGLLDRLRIAVGLASSEPPSGAQIVGVALNRFRNDTNARRLGLTQLIEVRADSTDPQLAARIANGLTETYIQIQLRSKIDSSLAGGQLLQDQLETARNALTETEDSVNNYIERNLDRFERMEGVDIASIRDELEGTLGTRESLADSIGTAEEALDSNDFTQLASLLEDQALQELANERARIERMFRSADSGSDRAVDLASELSRLEDRIQSEAQAELSTLRSSLSSLEQTANTQRDQIRESILGSDLPTEVLADIFRLQQEADIAQQQYSTLLSRSRQLQAEALVQRPDSRVVSEALAPTNPSSPNTKLIIALALVAGLGLGTAAALGNEFLFGGIISEDQLANVVPVPVAAATPLTTIREDQLSTADYVVQAPLSPYSESIRQIRASIDQTTKTSEDRGRLILVTSSIPAEGKTNIALSLARTFAVAGQGTILIDGDFRKPLLHRYVGLEPEKGFVDFLRDPNSLDLNGPLPFHTKDTLSDATLLLGRGRSNLPTDQLVQSKTFRNILEETLKNYDCVVLDTSPVLPVVDARYLVPFADVVVNCVRYGVTSQAEVRRGYASISAALGPDTALFNVLTMFEGRHRSYRYGGYYSTYG